MRLSDADKAGIINAVDLNINGEIAELRLYGSRTDSSKKGGDIDLLLICQQDKSPAELFDLKLNILIEIQKLIGEQKIDLIVTNKSKLKTDVFLKAIYPDSVLIKHYS